MFAVFARAILDRKRILAVFLAVSVAMMWMYVVTYPSLQATAAEVSEFVKSLPPELNKAFGLDPRSFTTFEGYVAGKQFSMIWPMMMVMLVGGMAANYISGDIEKGTMEMVLSQPITRQKIIISRILSGVFICFLFAAISVLSVIPMTKIYDINIPINHFFLISFIGFLFGLAVYGFSMLVSALFSEKGKALFLTIAILLTMYIINIVALLKASLEDIKFASYFYYYDYAGILLDGKVGRLSIIFFLISFLFFSAAGIVLFSKRDITS